MSWSKIQKVKEFFTSGGACGCVEKDVIEHKSKSKSKSNSKPDSCPKIEDSFAVVKDSDDPYHDFRESMLQMILEREMYSKEDLEKLLECFLHLNSPGHHDLILRAFMDIWNGSGGAAQPPRRRRHRRLLNSRAC